MELPHVDSKRLRMKLEATEVELPIAVPMDQPLPVARFRYGQCVEPDLKRVGWRRLRMAGEGIRCCW